MILKVWKAYQPEQSFSIGSITSSRARNRLK
jgi:hypothetical protein